MFYTVGLEHRRTAVKDSKSTRNSSIVISSTARGRFYKLRDVLDASANRDNDRNTFKFYSSNFAEGLIGFLRSRLA